MTAIGSILIKKSLFPLTTTSCNSCGDSLAKFQSLTNQLQGLMQKTVFSGFTATRDFPRTKLHTKHISEQHFLAREQVAELRDIIFTWSPGALFLPAEFT